MRGYAATRVTHCVRAPDVPGRRIAIIVRIVRPGAPIASTQECVRPRADPRPAGGGEERARWERDGRRGAPQGGKGAPAAQPSNRPPPPPPPNPGQPAMPNTMPLPQQSPFQAWQQFSMAPPYFPAAGQFPQIPMSGQQQWPVQGGPPFSGLPPPGYPPTPAPGVTQPDWSTGMPPRTDPPPPDPAGPLAPQAGAPFV
eukprot:gene19745-biopygen35886